MPKNLSHITILILVLLAKQTKIVYQQESKMNYSFKTLQIKDKQKRALRIASKEEIEILWMINMMGMIKNS